MSDNDFKQMKQALRRPINRLLALLRDLERSQVVSKKGRKLNSKKLVKSYSYARSNMSNIDRYKRNDTVVKQSTGLYFALDMSASMKHFSSESIGTYFYCCKLLIEVLASTLIKEKIDFKVALVDFDYMSDEHSNQSTAGVLPVANEYIDKKSLKNFRDACKIGATSNTKVADYAYIAYEGAKDHLSTDRKIAIFLTDGDCDSYHYLQSIHNMARYHDITLMGVCLGDNFQRNAKTYTPNGVFSPSIFKLGEAMIEQIIAVIKKGSDVETLSK